MIELFLEEARRALTQAERAVTAAKRAGAGLTGSLRVGFVASAVHDLLPRLLRGYREQYADVALELREATTTQQVADLRLDRLDVGLIVPPLVYAEDLVIETVSRGRFVAALPEGHRLAASQGVLALTDLAEAPWILFPAEQGPGLHARILTACAEAGFAPSVVQEASQMDTIAGLVAGGLGVALVPASLALAGRRDVVFRDLSGPGTPVGYELALAWKADAQPATLGAFIAIVRRLTAVQGGAS